MRSAGAFARQQQLPSPADLHLHSAHSDGTESPAEVVRQAHAAGVRTLSLTDHDRTSGWGEAAAEAARLGMGFLPGMELSAHLAGRSIHILAYLFDPENAELKAECARIRDDRIGRAERIVRRISRDYNLAWVHVLEQTAEDATIGRPHIADALVARGIVQNRSEAFAGILHPREGYYEPHYAPNPFTAVQLIAAAGGVSVIAHPAAAGRERILSAEVWDELISLGLNGVEIGHRENDPAGRQVLQELAQRHNLIITGSSDYHGAGKPNLPGENTTDPEMVARIVELGTGSAPGWV